jgi:hypothetical protein
MLSEESQRRVRFSADATVENARREECSRLRFIALLLAHFADDGLRVVTLMLSSVLYV